MVKGVCCICHKNIGGFLDKKLGRVKVVIVSKAKEGES